MNQLKSRILRKNELSSNPYEEVQKQKPRNLSQLTSAHEATLDNAPVNQYTKPKRYQMAAEQRFI
jgi:hypothetical protein